jgi:micrococcal nuclease
LRTDDEARISAVPAVFRAPMKAGRWRLAAPAIALAALFVGALADRAWARAQIFQMPCTPGSSAPLCYAENAQLLWVDDGDTIDVRIPGASSDSRVRMTAINATEQSAYDSNPGRQRGECWALNANYLLTAMLRRASGRLRLVYQNRLTRAGVRFVKDAQVLIRSSWHDLNSLLVSRGYALFMPNGREWAWNREYMFLMQQAAARGIGMFDPTFCGFGPDQDIPLQVSVQWNAPGDDTVNINGEFVRIFNRGARPLDLTGWWVRDSSPRRFHFPAGTVIQPGGRITVHVGRGTDDPDTLYWRLHTPIFDNQTSDERAIGDGAYLFDPQGDLRAWQMYPCRLSSCTNPL